MAHHRIEVDAECTTCKGTGLYVGMGERCGAAVVCHQCKGTGCHKRVIEWDDFEQRKERDDVRRVLKTNPGICVGEDKEKGPLLEDFGGMPYEDWLEGKPFPPKSEMRQFCCPAWWYQSEAYGKKPKWDECIAVGTFASCKQFCNKEQCWKRWDEEFGQDA